MRTKGKARCALRMLAGVLSLMLAVSLMPAPGAGALSAFADDLALTAETSFVDESPFADGVAGADATPVGVGDAVDTENADASADGSEAAGESGSADGEGSAGEDGSDGSGPADETGPSDEADPDGDATTGDDAVLEPGTYTVTANLAMPGEYNPVLVGVTVYANSPDNPFDNNDGTAGPVLDGNDPAEASKAVPMTPESDNATLVVSEDGTRTLVLPIKNPVFTTQSLGICADLTEVSVVRSAPVDPSKWTFGAYETRITSMTAVLTDGAAPDGQASYVFRGSVLYAVPLDLRLEPSGSVALELTVDYASLTRISDESEVPESPGGGGDSGLIAPTPSTGGDASNPGDSSGSVDATPSGGQSGSGSSATNSGTGHYAEGTYTVSANIWFDRSDTGLPLNPHITSSAFPPMNPVEGNATLRVDSSGRAQVTVPIVIQSRVMAVRSISGLSILSSVSSGGALSSITVDLGVLLASETTITRSCTVSVHIGELAMTIASGIFQGVYDQTWPATFQVNFSGVPNSGGGAIPSEVLAIMSGSEGVSDTATAEADALAALEQVESRLATGSSNGSRTSATGEASSDEAASAGLPTAGIVAGCLGAAAVVAIAAVLVWRRMQARA